MSPTCRVLHIKFESLFMKTKTQVSPATGQIMQMYWIWGFRTWAWPWFKLSSTATARTTIYIIWFRSSELLQGKRLFFFLPLSVHNMTLLLTCSLTSPLSKIEDHGENLSSTSAQPQPQCYLKIRALASKILCLVLLGMCSVYCTLLYNAHYK